MVDGIDDREPAANSFSPIGPLAPSRPGEALRRPADIGYPLRPNGESGCLSVGPGITLSGEVNSCDRLFIEGSVEANLTNCRVIAIAKSGLFKGSTSIEEAEVSGRFEGNLVVRKRLLIKATGRVSGTVRYGQIEIERGGRIFGDIQAQPAGELDEVTKPLPELPMIHDARERSGLVVGSVPDDRPTIP
jgi:cytoskeletal protein CcmA (bactofilin family)